MFSFKPSGSDTWSTNVIWTVRSSLRLSEDASVVAGDALSVGVGEYSNAVASGVGIHGPCNLVHIDVAGLTGCVAAVDNDRACAGSVRLRRTTFAAGDGASDEKLFP